MLCYYLSAALGPAVLSHSEKWQHRIDRWADRVREHDKNLLSYLIVIRWVALGASVLYRENGELMRAGLGAQDRPAPAALGRQHCRVPRRDLALEVLVVDLPRCVPLTCILPGFQLLTFCIPARTERIGIAGVSYIHTQIGTTLDQMTSSADFHLISWQNGVGLGGSASTFLAAFRNAVWARALSRS